MVYWKYVSLTLETLLTLSKGRRLTFRLEQTMVRVRVWREAQRTITDWF